MDLRDLQTRRKTNWVARLWPWLIAALFIEALVFSPMLARLFEPSPKKKLTPVELRQLSSKQWLENKTIRPKMENERLAELKKEQKKEEEKKEKEPEKLRGQIVDIAIPEKEEIPDNSEYLSQYNSKVEKQSKARDRDVYDQPAPKKSVAKLTKPSKAIQTQPDRIVIDGDGKKPDSPRLASPDRVLIPDMKMSRKLALIEGGDRPVEQREQDQPVEMDGNVKDRLQAMFDHLQKEQKDGQQGTGMPQNIPPSLMPNSADASQVTGGPMNDYLGDVEEGDETWLNTKAFKYATYFNRIKRMVSSNWHPLTVQRRYDPYFTIYGYKDRHTILHVALDAEGNLTDVRIAKTCGVDYLDQEAVRAMADAAPFPNPPPGLIEDGLVRFPFGFYLQLNRSSWHIGGGR